MDERDYKAMNDELKSAEELMSYEESRKYLISEGLDPNQIAKEGMVFIKTVKENIELKKQLEDKNKLIKGLAQTGNFYRNQLKEKEQESIMLEKMCNRAQDHAEQLLKQLTKSNEMAERLAEALDIFNRADANSGLQTSILKHNELIFIRKALTEYQNSKK